MRLITWFGAMLLIVGLMGCVGPEGRKANAEASAAEARAEMEKQRLMMLKEFHECVKREVDNASERCAYLKEAAR